MFAVTVVVPVYRNRDRIAATITSVLKQPNVDVRLIVVIDEQCPQTRDIVEAFGDKVDVIVNDRRMGAPWCRNLGLARSATEYVLFLDSDDYLEGPLLWALGRRMEASMAHLGFGQTILEYEDGRPRQLIPMPEDSGPALFEKWCRHEAFSVGCGVMWRTEFLRSIGGWDERLERDQDIELVLRALVLGASTCISTEGAGIYVQHDGPDRITRSGDYSSCMLAAKNLLEISPTSFPPSLVKRVFADRVFMIGASAFERNDAPIAEEALATLRTLGLRTGYGRPLTKLLITVFGVRAIVRLRSRIRPSHA